MEDVFYRSYVTLKLLKFIINLCLAFRFLAIKAYIRREKTFYSQAKNVMLDEFQAMTKTFL